MTSRTTPIGRDTRAWGVDACRVLAALAVFTYHFILDYRIETGHWWLSAGLDGRLSATLGSWGVCVFVVLSGLGLGWSYGPRGVCGKPYWHARLFRIYPTYWWVAVPLTALAAAVGTLSTADFWMVPIWWAGVSFVTPQTFYPIVDSWWYIGLALQLYCLFPLLVWIARRRDGLMIAAALSAGGSLTYAFVFSRMGVATPYLQAWFIGLSYALPFFAGILLSSVRWGPEASNRRRSQALAVAISLASLLALALLANRWVPLVLAVSAVTVVAPRGLAQTREPHGALRLLGWLAALSFVFFLAHSPWARPIIRELQERGATNRALVFLVCLVVALLVSVFFWGTFRVASRWVGRRFKAMAQDRRSQQAPSESPGH
jgi:peptidoglycan/LPS O-acetylase OafA/YrhL